jgi:hypothetical protein
MPGLDDVQTALQIRQISGLELVIITAVTADVSAKEQSQMPGTRHRRLFAHAGILAQAGGVARKIY